jgi:prepilin-type processing-associated H-X9-DG protein
MYAPNHISRGKDKYAYLRINQVRDPSGTCELADAVQSSSGQSSGIYTNTDLLKPPSTSTNYGEPDYRHQGGCNVLFIDSHVAGFRTYGIPNDITNTFWKKD